MENTVWDVNAGQTHSGLELRQRRLKMWRYQLKWLVFDMKLLVGTAENISRFSIKEGKKYSDSSRAFPVVHLAFSPDDLG